MVIDTNGFERREGRWTTGLLPQFLLLWLDPEKLAVLRKKEGEYFHPKRFTKHVSRTPCMDLIQAKSQKAG